MSYRERSAEVSELLVDELNTNSLLLGPAGARWSRIVKNRPAESFVTAEPVKFGLLELLKMCYSPTPERTISKFRLTGVSTSDHSSFATCNVVTAISRSCRELRAQKILQGKAFGTAFIRSALADSTLSFATLCSLPPCSKALRVALVSYCFTSTMSPLLIRHSWMAR